MIPRNARPAHRPQGPVPGRASADEAMTHFDLTPESHCAAPAMRFRSHSNEGIAAQTGSHPSALLVSRSLGKEGFYNIENLVLFPMGQHVNQLKSLAYPASRKPDFRGLRLTENLLDRQSQCFRYPNHDIGTGERIGAFPVAHIARRLANLTCQFAQGYSCAFTQSAKIVTDGLRHGLEKVALGPVEPAHVNLHAIVQGMLSPMTTKKNGPCNVQTTARICARNRTHLDDE